MTREQYTRLRQHGDFNIVYEFYKEKFDHSKHRPFLGMQDVANLLLNLGYNVNEIMNKCVEHYDKEFNIVKVSDKNGNPIAVL